MKIFFVGCCVVLLCVGIGGLAGATTVENEIHVKASTGGNTAGNVQEGTSKTEVFIETVVDGQVVEHIEETRVEESGNQVEIEVQTEVESSFLVAIVEFFRSILDKLFFA